MWDDDDTVIVIRPGKFMRGERGRYMEHCDTAYSVEVAT